MIAPVLMEQLRTMWVNSPREYAKEDDIIEIKQSTINTYVYSMGYTSVRYSQKPF